MINKIKEALGFNKAKTYHTEIHEVLVWEGSEREPKNVHYEYREVVVED